MIRPVRWKKTHCEKAVIEQVLSGVHGAFLLQKVPFLKRIEQILRKHDKPPVREYDVAIKISQNLNKIM